MRAVAIIGGGAVGVAALQHLVHILRPDAPVHIRLFEKGGVIGPGQAYAEHNDDLLLNRTAETMSLDDSRPHLFSDWCISNATALQDEFPMLQSRASIPHAYLPRRLFGRYIAATLSDTLHVARRKRLPVDLVCDEVVGLCCAAGCYRLQCASGDEFFAASTIIAVGSNACPQYPNLVGSPKYFLSPYPASKLRDVIPRTASVGIIGSRLSAIDAVLSLSSGGHAGPVLVASRSGLLPGVSSETLDRRAPAIWNSVTAELAGRLTHTTLHEIGALVVNAVHRLTGIPTTISDGFVRPRDAEASLRHALSLANDSSARAWQSVWRAMNSVIEHLWHALPTSEKRLFLRKLHSRWMTVRVGMPEHSARRLLALLESESVQIVGGLSSAHAHSSGVGFGLRFTSKPNERRVEYLIDATGGGNRASGMSSRLVRQLLADRVASEHEFGGLAVAFDGSAIIDADGRPHSGLYAVGRLTSGTYLFTSVLELNVRHAHRIAARIARQY